MLFGSSRLDLSTHRLKALLLIGTAEKKTCSSGLHLPLQASGAKVASEVAVQFPRSFLGGLRC